MTPDALDPQPLLRFLHERNVAHIIIGGVAVAAHGYPRPTMDLDVVPDPGRNNLTRLAAALGELHAVSADRDEFATAEFPIDACDVDDLAGGGTSAWTPISGRLTSCSGSLTPMPATSTPSSTPPR